MARRRQGDAAVASGARAGLPWAGAMALNRAGGYPHRAPGDLGIWVKRDDLSHPRYGGNKPRKLRGILEEARRAGATRLFTMGAAGSHHVLATTIFGRAAGFEVEALLTPQPWSPHAVETLRASLAQGVEHGRCAGPGSCRRRCGRRGGLSSSRWGGSNVAGALGYVDAVEGLKQAIDRGQARAPGLIVVPAGSGGTAAGLAAGLVLHGLDAHVVAAAVVNPPLVRAQVLALAARLARSLGLPVADVLRRVSVDGSAVGRGYGHGTAEGAEAGLRAAACGLTLDPTYARKAVALSLRLAREGREVLYWHTLSSAPVAPLLAGAPAELPRSLRAPAHRGLAEPAAPEVSQKCGRRAGPRAGRGPRRR